MLILATALTVSNAPPYPAQFSDLRPIPVHLGVNEIPNLADDGRTGLIIAGWRDNGNAHGYHLFEVMLPTSVGGQDWNIVGVEKDDGLEDVIRDAPHTGEDQVRSVRFVRGTLDGQPATLLVTATRDPRTALPDPAITTIAIFRLRKAPLPDGTTRDIFEPVMRMQTRTAYCNADTALQTELGLRVGSGYEGPLTASGC